MTGPTTGHDQPPGLADVAAEPLPVAIASIRRARATMIHGPRRI
jgi:hypothetical protein